MNADDRILQLPHVSLKGKDLLPEYSGIYYVVDEKYVIWYVGQAKNIRTRWTGKNHHRFYQLQKQRKKQFTIYYEPVVESLLNVTEQQRIEQYNPQLNGTRVRTKKLRATETLLRETLLILAPYSFVLGVESPRKEDSQLIEDSIYWRNEWRVQKAVLPLRVIHVCVNLKELEDFIKDYPIRERFLRKVFRKRSNYSDNWICKPTEKAKHYDILPLRRLLVNGFAIEVYKAQQETIEQIQGYKLTQLAGVNIKAVNEESLAILRDKCLLSSRGIYIPFDDPSQPYYQHCRRAIRRLSPYQEDLVKLLFKEDIDTSKLQVLPTESKPTEESDTELSVRLSNLAAKKAYLKNLLSERGINLNLYQVNKYLENIPIDDSYVDNHREQRMNVYVKSFSGDLRQTTYYSNAIYGSKGIQYQSSILHDSYYKEVYLTYTVDRVFWLLLETYLSDFVKVKLTEEEGYIKKVYISARKFIVPAMLTITLGGKWKTVIPFGPRENLSYNETVNIIKDRLQMSGIPKLKFSFQSESTRT